MTRDLYSGEIQGAIDRLKAGGRLFVIEEKPYPHPHNVVVVLDKERYSISYNDFALLSTQHIILPAGTTFLDGFQAEVYELSPNFHAQAPRKLSFPPKE